MSDAPVTYDEFDAWLLHPATKWLREAAKALADDRREAWTAASWEAGNASPETLRELRGQADAHLWLADISYDGICAALEQDPVADSR